MLLWHATSIANGRRVCTGGLRPVRFAPRWGTLTTSRRGALSYGYRSPYGKAEPGGVVLGFDVPESEARKFFWPEPIRAGGFGTQYALRRPLPARFIRVALVYPYRGRSAEVTCRELRRGG